MEISGHKTRSMFDRYNIVDEDDLRTVLQRPSRYVAALKTTPAVAVSGESGAIYAASRNTKGPEALVFRALSLVAGARFELWKRPLKFEFLLTY